MVTKAKPELLMENLQIFSISELVQLARPLTGRFSSENFSSASFEHATNLDSWSFSGKKRKFQSGNDDLTSGYANHVDFPIFTDNFGQNPRALESLKRSALIIGTVNLWTDVSVRNPCCLKNDCFSFTDGCSTVCCAVLDRDIKMIGRRIHVLAWNFIPSKCSGGFLEIIEWKIPEPLDCVNGSSNFDTYPLNLSLESSEIGDPLFGSSCTARARVFGRLNSVSPVLVVPCTVPSRVSVNPKLNSNNSGSNVVDGNRLPNNSVSTPSQNSAFGQNSDEKTKDCSKTSEILFPKGLGSSNETDFHTETGNLIGFLVEVMVCDCIRCRTDASGMPSHDLSQNKWCHSFLKPVFLYLCGSAVAWRPVFSKLIGIVVSIAGLKKKLIHVGKKESYLMFVTTQKTVLYPDWRALKIESSELGSMSSLSTNKLAVKESNVRKCSSGLYAGVVTGVYMQGMVVELDGKVWLVLTDQLLVPVHSLRVGALISLRSVHFFVPNFSWVRMLLLKACSKTNMEVKSFSPLSTQCHSRCHMQSLLGKFIESLTFSARFWVLLTVSCFKKKFAGIFSEKEILGSKKCGVFKEFCEHDGCFCKEDPNFGPLKLAVPMSNFISKSEAIWVTWLSQMQKDAEIIGRKTNASFPSCDGKSFDRSFRRIISGKDLGVVLLGTLQISPSSGRLQLIDATGCIDVVIPDLQSSADVQGIYEVKDYRLVIEGFAVEVSSLGMATTESFSCRNIFHRTPPKRMLNQLTLYVHFCRRNAIRINFPTHLPACKDKTDDFKGSGDGKFHLLQVTHKFPAIQNFQEDPIVSDRSIFYAEVKFLPYNLYIPRDKGVSPTNRVPRDKLEEKSFYANAENSKKMIRSKRAKMVHASGSALPSASKVDQEEVGNLGSPLEIACSVTVRSSHDHRSLVAPGILFCANGNAKDRAVGKPSAHKVLLEFNSENFSKFQLLRIGFYYVMTYGTEELLHNAKDTSDYVDKVLITSKTLFWSLFFSSGGDLHQNGQQVSARNGSMFHDHSLAGSSLGNREFEEIPKNVLLFQIPVTCSGTELHLSAEAIDLLKVEAVKDGPVRSFVTLRGVLDVSMCIRAMVAAPLQALGTPIPSSSLPKGNLISLHGEVVDVHSFNCNSVEARKPHGCVMPGDIYQSRHSKNIPSSICIHVREGHHMVRVCGALSKHSYPIGMGPGVTATFHRVLLPSDSSRRRELMLTPVSFIEIESITEVDHCYIDKYFLPLHTPDILNEELFNIVSPGLISQLIQCLETKPIRLHGRVVSVHILVLESLTCKYEKPRLREPVVGIPLAGFILDDGSAFCCCWASAENAATLLRLHETSVMTVGSSFKSSRKTGSNKLQNTAGYHLEKMLKKHHKVTVKNQGSVHDLSCLDFTYSVHSNKVLSISDETLLKFIILNAGCGSVLSVVGSMLDINDVGVIKELRDLQVPLQSRENIWASEVGFVNPLAEARNIVQALTS